MNPIRLDAVVIAGWLPIIARKFATRYSPHMLGFYKIVSPKTENMTEVLIAWLDQISNVQDSQYVTSIWVNDKMLLTMILNA
jgi:hypothetical protein